MFKQISGILLVSVFAAFAGGPEHMQKGTAPQTIAADPANAVIVFHTNTNFHLFKPLFEYYVDSAMVGQTQTNSYFLVTVTPGQHWLFLAMGGKVSNKGRIDFKAGKLYYVLEKAVPGGQVWVTQTPDDFKKYMDELKPQFLEFKPAKTPPALKQKEMAKAQAEFEKDLKEDPGKHDDFVKYQGY